MAADGRCRVAVRPRTKRLLTQQAGSFWRRPRCWLAGSDSCFKSLAQPPCTTSSSRILENRPCRNQARRSRAANGFRKPSWERSSSAQRPGTSLKASGRCASVRTRPQAICHLRTFAARCAKSNWRERRECPRRTHRPTGWQLRQRCGRTRQRASTVRSSMGRF